MNYDYGNWDTSQLADFSRAGTGTTSVLNQAARDRFANAGSGVGFDFLPPFLRGGSGASQTGTGAATTAPGGQGMLGDLGGIAGILGGLGNLGNLWMAWKSLGTVDRMFDFQEEMAEKNYAANRAAYQNAMDAEMLERRALPAHTQPQYTAESFNYQAPPA